MEEKKLVGYHSFISKAGEKFVVIDVIGKVTSRERESGYVGAEKVESIFVPKECYDKLNEQMIGKSLVCNFEVSNGRAYLVDFDVKK